MVSLNVILLALGLIGFFAFGGGKLIVPAIATAREDISFLRGEITKQVRDIKASTEAGKVGDKVG